jgi:GR25 family glycosyltransferase involved in LPS biosynthesis
VYGIDQVFLINLKRRTDRLNSFRLLQKENGWKIQDPVIVEAIDGNVVGVPNYFHQGGGAWGCCLSHRNILQTSIMNGQSCLVLEDDVIWKSNAWDQLDDFMKKVPSDWDQIMFGGQHQETPTRIIDGVSRCNNTQRTHAYAIRGDAAKSLLNLWFTCSVHIDWVMGPWQKNWNVYAPSPFIFGQSGGRSDISGNMNEKKFWISPEMSPVVFLDCPSHVVNSLRGYSLHMGFERCSECYDKGLSEIVKSEHKNILVKNWLSTLMWEAASMENTYVAVWHPEIPFDLIAKNHIGETIYCKGESVEQCFDILKDLNLKRNYSASHCMVFRGPRSVAENLIGFHMGNWRDSVTGLDHGIRESEYLDGENQIDRLKKWFQDISPESERMGKVPLIWSNNIPIESIKKSTYRTVIEISSKSTEEAIASWMSNLS